MPYHDLIGPITAAMAEAEPLEERLFYGPPPDRGPVADAAAGVPIQLSFTWDADDAPRIVRPEIRAAQKLLIMPSGKKKQ